VRHSTCHSYSWLEARIEFMHAHRFILAAAALALTGCIGDAREDPREVTPSAELSAPALPAPPPPALSAEFTAEGGTQITGTADVLWSTNASAAFRVRVLLAHVPAGEHAWHIHQGSCGVRDTPVVVPFTEDRGKPAIAAPLVAGSDGNVAAEADVPANLLSLDQLRAADYSLHVHQKPGIDHGPTIACATL
jgi:hypothetical protein